MKNRVRNGIRQPRCQEWLQYGRRCVLEAGHAGEHTKMPKAGIYVVAFDVVLVEKNESAVPE